MSLSTDFEDLMQFINYKLKIILIVMIFLIPLDLYPIKFKFKDKNDREHVIQALFDTGFSVKGVSDAAGITDYETFFTRSVFSFDDFSFGTNFEFRFRFFLGEAGYYSYTYNGNHITAFDYLDWYIPEGYLPNAGINTLILYLDKIDFIRYGTPASPFYFNMGKNPYTTFGSGFLVRDFHNQAFLPAGREFGVYFKFNGEELEKLNLRNLPLDITFLMNDLADPDIFALDSGIDVMKFTPYRDKYKLRVGTTFALDVNSTESNRLSSQYVDQITSYRNLTTTYSNIYTSFPLFTDFNDIFEWENNIVKLTQSNDIGMLLDFNNSRPFNAGFGLKAHVTAKFINIENSGKLLGISTGMILQSPHYFLDYFSSNYEILRKKQYLALDSNKDYTFFIMAGLGLYGFNEKVRFEFNVTIPLIAQFTARFSMKFIMENTVVPGLFFDVYYETGMNAIYTEGNGGGFIDSITRDFRFSFEAGYNFYGAKMSILIGVQRPWFAVPGTSTTDMQPYDPYAELAQGYVVPTKYTQRPGQKDYSMYDWYDTNLSYFARDIQKFVSVEISFVF